MAKDKKIKKIEVNITHKEIDVENGNTIVVYNVNMRTGSGVWDEPASSKEYLEAVIRGINMALGMMGVHGGIPSSTRTPFTMEIICHEAQVCKDFKLPR